jgi:hypothetical protein
LVNPTSAQDAATRSYVDTEFGSSGVLVNHPTVQGTYTTASTHYLTFVNSTDLPSNSTNKRAILRSDDSLSYNPSSNTLTAGTFSGNASTATSAGSATTAGDISKSSTSTFTVGGAERMRITSTGYVGIGTTAPSYALHVYHIGLGYASVGGYRFDGGQNLVFTDTSSRPVTMGVQGGWLACDNGVIMFSDQRIKTDIINVDIQSNLELFRKIRPVKHGYIDKLEYGNVHKYGFIAQEVQQLLPDAVIKGTQIIPSIYKTATVVNNVLLHFDKPIQDIKQFSIGTKLKCYDDKNEIVWVVIKAIIDTQNIEIEEKITNDRLFVYGHSVDDFLQLDHDTIYTVATAALQEVDRQQQADKARIAELEAKVSEQQSLINDILERLKKVGA